MPRLFQKAITGALTPVRLRNCRARSIVHSKTSPHCRPRQEITVRAVAAQNEHILEKGFRGCHKIKLTIRQAASQGLPNSSRRQKQLPSLASRRNHFVPALVFRSIFSPPATALFPSIRMNHQSSVRNATPGSKTSPKERHREYFPPLGA